MDLMDIVGTQTSLPLGKLEDAAIRQCINVSVREAKKDGEYIVVATSFPGHGRVKLVGDHVEIPEE